MAALPAPPPLVWVTGAGGLIGRYLLAVAPEVVPIWTVRGLTRRDLDLADLPALRQRFREDRPARVIHCAGLTASPACQEDPPLARQLNVAVTTALVALASDIPLTFLSTDLVFDGRQPPYNELGIVNPLTVYAQTKLEAEQRVLANPRHTVIRTSLNAGVSASGRRAFNEELRHAWATGQTTRLFTDEFRSPIAAVVTARAIWELAAQAPPGLYHVAGSQRLSRLEMGRLLAGLWPELNPRIVPMSLAGYGGPPRSPDTTLDSRKAQAWLSFPLPKFECWLEANPTALQPEASC